MWRKEEEDVAEIGRNTSKLIRRASVEKVLTCFWGWCVQGVDRRTVSDPCSSGHYSYVPYVRQTTPLLIRILHFFQFFHFFSSFHYFFIYNCLQGSSFF